MKLDCIIISSGEILDDTEKIVWDRMNSDWYNNIIWQWAQYENKYYSVDSLLNLAKDKYPDIVNKKFTKFNHFETPQFNGIYLLNYLRKNNLKTDLINNIDIDKQKFLDLAKLKPQFVILSSTFTFSTFVLNEVVTYIRKQIPESKIIIGGSYIYNLYLTSGLDAIKNIFDYLNPDFIFLESQGEKSLISLIKNYKEKKSLSNVKNLIYKNEQNEIIINLFEKENNSIEENCINWSLVDDQINGNSVNFQISRSCPYRCAFCSFSLLAGVYQCKSINTIKNEFEEIAKLKKIKNIIFIDDTLNTTKKNFINLCQLIKNYNFKWFSFLRCNNLDEETVSIMKESGCKAVFIGFESGDDNILKNMNKKITVDEFKNGLKLLHKYGIITFGSFILGFPGETQNSIINTFDLIENNNLDFYSINEWYYSHKTPIFLDREKFGLAGNQNSWKHNTMDSTQVKEHFIFLFKNIKKSVFLPANSISGVFWTILYYLNKGLSAEKIKSIFNIYSEFIKLNLDKNKYENQIKENLLKELASLLK